MNHNALFLAVKKDVWVTVNFIVYDIQHNITHVIISTLWKHTNAVHVQQVYF